MNSMTTAIAEEPILASDDNIIVEEVNIKDYISLLKPRVMSLVVFTGFVGLFLAPGSIHPFLAVIAIFCIALGSGAAGAINMWYERDIDAVMERTKSRPIPAGRMPPENALDFALVSAFASVFIMAFAVNLAAAGLLLTAILFYVFVYTIWLKPRTPQNIVIGGAAGAFPPMIGWAAVTSDITLMPILLFAIVFMWTPPHFWALSLYRCKDYAKAGIPMLPVVVGNKRTSIHMLLYTFLLAPVTLAPVMLGYCGLLYLVTALYLNARFIYCACQVVRRGDEKSARKMFGFSLLYLFALFVALIADHLSYVQVV